MWVDNTMAVMSGQYKQEPLENLKSYAQPPVAEVFEPLFMI